MKLISILTIILVFIIQSCDLNNLNHYDEQLKLNRFKKDIGDSLWSGLPDKIDENIRVICAYNPAVLKHNLNYYGIFISESFQTKNYFQEKINELVNKNESNSKIFELTEINKVDSLQIFDIKGIQDELINSKAIKYVIPNYREEYSPIKDSLSVNSQVLIIKTQFDLVLDDEYIEYSGWLDKHGFSKGFYIDRDDKEIYYWIINW